jgi:hypothetical protein
MKTYGYIPDVITDDNYVLGGTGSIGGVPLRPDRDWRPFVPKIAEYQNINNIDPQACTNFGTSNALETLIKYHLSQDRNYSDRYFAKLSGTDPYKGGNSPHKVAEWLRKNGDVLESEWPMDHTIDTLEKYYAEPPLQLQTSAKKLPVELEITHEWVPADPDSIYNALQFSPLGVSVSAWNEVDGLYVKNQPENHWCVLVFAEYGKYWLVLDSYPDDGQPYKKLHWDHLTGSQVKRYSIRVRSKDEIAKDLSILEQIANILKKILNLLMPPKDEPKPIEPTKELPVTETRLYKFCKAIEQFEHYAPGSASYRRNNPGNIKARNGQFIVYKTYDEGFAALMDYVKRAATGKHAAYKPEYSIKKFFSIYAPDGEKVINNYSSFVAVKAGLSTTDPIAKIVA